MTTDPFDLSVFKGSVSKDAQLARGEKRHHRKVASKGRWAKIVQAKLGDCYVCRYLGVRQAEPSTLHHCVARSLGGADTEANCVPLCGSGTSGHHGAVEAHDRDVCRAFAAALQQYDDAAYSYAVDKLGEDGFLRRYHVRFERP